MVSKYQSVLGKKINPWKTTLKNLRLWFSKEGVGFWPPPRGHSTASGDIWWSQLGGGGMLVMSSGWRVPRILLNILQGTVLPRNKGHPAPNVTVPRLRIPGLRILFWCFTQFIYSGHLTSSSWAFPRNSYLHPQSEAPGLFHVQLSAGNCLAPLYTKEGPSKG